MRWVFSLPNLSTSCSSSRWSLRRTGKKWFSLARHIAIFSFLLSTRTKHLVYIFTFTFYKNWRPKREKMTSVFDFTCFARPETREEYCTVELLSREVFTAIPVNDMLLRTKKQFWFELFTGRFSSWLNITVSIDNNCSKDTRLKIWVLFRRIILSSYIQQNTLNEKRTMSHMNYETIYLRCFVVLCPAPSRQRNQDIPGNTGCPACIRSSSSSSSSFSSLLTHTNLGALGIFLSSSTSS